MEPTKFWAPYTPDAAAPWDLKRVVHLHRRTGFAVTWPELQRDLRDGPAASVDRLLRGTSRENVPATFDAVVGRLAAARPQAWWVYRMFAGPDPLGERLTLVWHNHFATSQAKVRDAALMRRQNDNFRRIGRGDFGDLLRAAVRDPALLMYLDAPANRKGHANENLARELMELFTLGVGHYTEADVKGAARALTGFRVKLGESLDWPAQHDAGTKTILGRRGRFDRDDLVAMLLEHPATSRRLSWRICDWLMGENVVGDAGLDELAADLRRHNLNVGRAVGVVLRSRVFFSAENVRSKVAGPAEYVVGLARALERFDPPASSVVMAEWSARLGQELFHPPNVGGWPGGRAWLTSRGVVGRGNYAFALVEGRISARRSPMDAAGFARRHGRDGGTADLIDLAAELLTGAPPGECWRGRLMSALKRERLPRAEEARRAVALVAASPECQLS